MHPIGKNHPALSKLRQLIQKPKLRKAEKLGVVEGPKLLTEALAASVELKSIFIGQQYYAQIEKEQSSLYQALVQFQPNSLLVLKDELLIQSLDASTPSPIAAITAWQALATEELSHLNTPSWFMVAVNIQDPGNLGNLWRTAEAAGASAILRVGTGAHFHHPRCWRASAGSCFRLPFLEIDEEQLIQVIKTAKFTLVGADSSEGESVDSYLWPDRVALVMGSEAHGISSKLKKDMKHFVHIPTQPPVESLSVGSAAAVLAFALHRHQTKLD